MKKRFLIAVFFVLFISGYPVFAEYFSIDRDVTVNLFVADYNATGSEKECQEFITANQESLKNEAQNKLKQMTAKAELTNDDDMPRSVSEPFCKKGLFGYTLKVNIGISHLAYTEEMTFGIISESRDNCLANLSEELENFEKLFEEKLEQFNRIMKETKGIERAKRIPGKAITCKYELPDWVVVLPVEIN